MLNHRIACIVFALFSLCSFHGSAETIPEKSPPSWVDSLAKLFVDLTCSVATDDGRRRMDITFHIDYLAKTVDGHEATISDTEIRWHREQNITAVINRHSGFMRIGNPKNPTIYTGSCSVAKDRKF